MLGKWMLSSLGLFLLLFPQVGKTADSVFATAGKILQIGVGGRAIGMGEAYTAVADDVYALYWNPAGLAEVNDYELAYMHNLWIGDIQDGYLSYAQPFLSGGLGIGLNYFNFGEFEKFDVDGFGYPIPLDETFTPYAMIVSVGYASAISRQASFGAALKIVSESVDTFSSMTMVLDAGFKYKNLLQDFDVGLMVQNLGMAIEGYAVPLNVRLGLAWRLIENKNDKFLIAFDGRMPLPFDDSYSANLGLEYDFSGIVQTRVGYKLSTINNLGSGAGLTAGIGVRLSNYAVDYALAPMGDLGLSHRISVSADFITKKKSKRPKNYTRSKLKRRSSRNGKKSEVNQELGSMMMSSLTRVTMRSPIKVNLETDIDNNDNTQIKKAEFRIDVNLQKSIKRWGLKILNANGKQVRGFSDEGKPPVIHWDGKDKQGKIIKETIFCTYAFEVLFEDGSVETLRGKLVQVGAEGKRTKSASNESLPKIYFEENSADLMPESIISLKKAAQQIKNRPFVKVRIKGFTDSGSEKTEGFLLSKRRIDRVVRYLTATGKISLSKIATRAYGSKKPVASNQSEAGRRKNRRVEITIVYKKK